MQHCYGLVFIAAIIVLAIVHDGESRKIECFARHILRTFMRLLFYMSIK